MRSLKRLVSLMLSASIRARLKIWHGRPSHVSVCQRHSPYLRAVSEGRAAGWGYGLRGACHQLAEASEGQVDARRVEGERAPVVLVQQGARDLVGGRCMIVTPAPLVRLWCGGWAAGVARRR